MSYETWYYLHFYTYLAIALAFSHQFAVGAAFTGSLVARFWWSALYLVVAALVLWYRIAVPVRDFARHQFRVAGVRQESPHTVSIYIKGRYLKELAAEPGQFFRWRFLTRGLWWQSHPYSLSAVPSDELMRITVQGIGDHSVRSPGSGPAPGCWPRDRSARSRRSAPAGRSCCWRAASASPRCGRCSPR